jgi:hypothetical protein
MLTLTACGWRPRLEALAVSARTVPLAVVGLGALAALPAVVTFARGGRDFALALQAAAMLAGAGAGFAADDQAANVLASSPTPLLARRGLRAVGVVLVLAAAAAVALLVARGGSPTPVQIDGPLCVLVAAAGASSAMAWVAAPDGGMAPGVSAAMGTVLLLLTASSLAERWPWVPTLASSSFDRRWVMVGAAGAAVALVRSRDPSARAARLVNSFRSQSPMPRKG